MAALDSVHRFTLEEYHRLIESGGFDEDAHIELIDGLLVDMSPRSPEHEEANAWLTRELVMAVDHKLFQVRAACALTLGTSEPEPDLAVVSLSSARPYHPSSAALVVEVSASSLRHDLTVKPPIYAAAGIPLYWVVDLLGRRVVVHTEPGADGYESVEIIGDDGELCAGELGLTLSVAGLFAAAYR